MELTALVDSSLPGEGSLLDRASATAQAAVVRTAKQPAVRPVYVALRGNEWLGHPIHPVVVAVPIGAWVVTA